MSAGFEVTDRQPVIHSFSLADRLGRFMLTGSAYRIGHGQMLRFGDTGFENMVFLTKCSTHPRE
ncbi:hypothetical protein NI18_21775 [Sphingomonas sp. Ant20]|nr:hypothetical protein NI18_21775 [Sphingomonas sp. Ant20]